MSRFTYYVSPTDGHRSGKYETVEAADDAEARKKMHQLYSYPVTLSEYPSLMDGMPNSNSSRKGSVFPSDDLSEK